MIRDAGCRIKARCFYPASDIIHHESDPYIVLERKFGCFVKIKEDENFNHSNTGSISRINPPEIGGGLKFESDPREISSAPVKY